MSRDVKLILKRRYITTILIVIIFNIFFVANAFGETEKLEEDFTINVEASESEEIVLNLINKEREKEGLKELKFDKRLMQLSKMKIDDMLEENYVSHNSDKYGNVFNMLKTNNISYNIAGENIARNLNEDLAVKAWMNSNSHRENILEERYEYTGISVIKDKEYGYLFVQIFM